MLKIDEEIRRLAGEMTQMRRELHRIPEKGLEEYQTSEYIRKKLRSFGIERVEDCLETGVVAVIENPREMPEDFLTVAFRADMDGLSVKEEGGLDYASCHPGMMHACGHDGHMALCLGFARYVWEHRDSLRARVVFVFQPAEEGPGGARLMIREGLIQKYRIDCFIGLHIFPEFEQGTIACRKGSLMPRNGEVTITVYGKSAHGAQPQKGADAVVAASSVVLALQSVISRSISPLEPALLTLGRIQGGEARNVIAGKVEITGTMRAFSDQVYESMAKRIEEVCQGVAQGLGCRAQVDFFHMYRVVNNDPRMVELLMEEAGPEVYQEAPLQMICEDFSMYQQQVPGLFFFLGSRNEKKGYIHPLHSAQFQFDEEILLLGAQAYKAMLERLQKEPGLLNNR